MMLKDVSNAWIKVAYDEWLHGCENCSNLREPTQRIIEQMNDALTRNDTASVEHLIDRLVNLSGKFQTSDVPREHRFEMAETLLECAWAAYRMDDSFAATKYLKEAIVKYTGNNHCKAVAHWILGCIMWQSPTLVTDAIYAWQSSCEIFKGRIDASNRPEYATWYEYWAEKMVAAIEDAVNDRFDYPPDETDWPTYQGRSPSKSASLSTSVTSSPKVQGPLHGHKVKALSPRACNLRAFPVFASIPAGGFIASPERVGRIEFEQVIIEGHAYRIENLQNKPKITLRDGVRYAVVKVVGDSMDLIGIKNDDYVLLRAQDDANDYDIVAAEIINVNGGESTLKEFLRRNGKIYLRPRSNNKEHQPYVFEKFNDGFFIRGVVIAIFKPL